MSDEPNTGQAGAADAARSVTVIGSNVVIEDGRVVVVRDLVIYGRVDADVQAGGRVVIARGATVSGRVEAEDISLSGRLDGSVDARDSFSLEDTGELYGNANARRLSVSPNASGTFRVAMRSGSPSQERTQVETARERYEAVLATVTEVTGRKEEPSAAYRAWSDHQSGRGAKKGASEEISIDSPDSGRASGAGATSASAGRAAWGKSVTPGLGISPAEQLKLTPEEIELILDEEEEQSAVESEGNRRSTDELLNSPILREAVESVRKDPENGDLDADDAGAHPGDRQ